MRPGIVRRWRQRKMTTCWNVLPSLPTRNILSIAYSDENRNAFNYSNCQVCNKLFSATGGKSPPVSAGVMSSAGVHLYLEVERFDRLKISNDIIILGLMHKELRERLV